jgi:SRSO17 transposase
VKIPDAVTFKTKIALALDMIQRAKQADIAGNIILADAAYGESSEFRNGVRDLDFDFAVGVPSTMRVVRLDPLDRVRGGPIMARELINSLGRKAFRKFTWRHGSTAKLSSHFRFVRVKTMHDDGLALADREPLWLVAEWLDGEQEPTKFVLTTLPEHMSKKQIVRIFRERWRTEQMYEHLKGELGLDHFEGRSFTGWHHHVSVVLCCYAFVVSERVSAFPPSADRARFDDPLFVAA